MKLALVTGANRGLGLETCRQLLGLGFHVVVSARRASDATEAASQLGDGAIPLELDVADPRSVDTTQRFLESMPPLDVLINNAGVSPPGFDSQVAQRTLQVNTWGAARLTGALRPSLPSTACVVMVTSQSGACSNFGTSIARELMNPTLSREQLHDLGRRFVETANQLEAHDTGFPRDAYAVSKALLNAAARILARESGPSGPRINAVCPGRVRTRLGGANAPRAVSEGARGIVWAATLDPAGPSGKCFRDGRQHDW